MGRRPHASQRYSRWSTTWYLSTHVPSVSTPLCASDSMAPTTLIVIQHTITKPTASHFIDGVATRLEAAAKHAIRKHRNAKETNTNPALPNRSKTGCCGPTGAVVFQPVRSNPALGHRRLHKRDRAMPRPLHWLGRHCTTNWLAQCRPK